MRDRHMSGGHISPRGPQGRRAVPAAGAEVRLRAGISLLEVTFSIGVVMIGLIGIAALIPVAGSQARQGADRRQRRPPPTNAVRDVPRALHGQS